MRNQSDRSDQSDQTDQKKNTETALRTFTGSDLRAASIGLLNILGYQSEKTLDFELITWLVIKSGRTHG